MPSLTVSTPYPDAVTATVDQLIQQVWYRQLGIVAVHYGIGDAYNAILWLSENGRHGSVKWVIPGRTIMWENVQVAPDLSGSPTIDIWLFGAALTQWNTVMVLKGFWAFYLSRSTTPGGQPNLGGLDARR